MGSKIGGWEKKFLSYGSRLLLIKSVLLSMPIHLLSVTKPPKGVLDRIERMLNKFFWGSSDIVQPSFISHERVSYYWNDGTWDLDKLKRVLPPFVAMKIVDIPFDEEEFDRPW
ncbi:UNVERIFIED_CONTAM: hypothetical protein Slati_3132700 [Sesamum latifolium]|uniref:Uncharacterized protein n=1 Tax=Sesamum latifolium TaxID=2727402 RepID=A0AAW2UWT3_9LAMI